MFLFFLFGLAVGSFLNVVINRTESGEDIVAKPSHCPNCGKKLFWYELIPLLSFAVQMGKCRGCKQRISWQYPLVEFSTGGFFALAYYFLSPTLIASNGLSAAAGDFLKTLELGWWLTALSFFIVIFVYDFKYYLIPNQFIYPAVALALIYNSVAYLLRPCDFSLWSCPLWGGLFAAGIAFSFFFLLIVLSRGRWMGGGDAKLAIFMGLVLGWPNILAALFLAFFVGSVFGLALVFAGQKGLKSEMPFGPFLAGASIAVMFLGERLIKIYLGFLGF